MTQPGYAVAPKPELAAVLRQMQLPPNWKLNAALRDYVLSVAENGVLLEPSGQRLENLINLIDKLIGAQLETTVILAGKVDQQR